MMQKFSALNREYQVVSVGKMNKYLIKLNLSDGMANAIWKDIKNKRHCVDIIVGQNNEGIEVEALSATDSLIALCTDPHKFVPTYRGAYPLRQDIWTVSLVEPLQIKEIISNVDGMFCAGCDNFFPMASANQPDGKLKCYTCRKYHSYH